MRVHKRASKRTNTKQREKVKRKVREHKRKSKREAKKDVTWKTRKRQDPGIPNSFPYKEQLLDQIEQRRIAAEQQKLQDKESRLAASEDVEEEEEAEQEMELEEEDEEAEDEDEAETAELYDGSLKSLLEEEVTSKTGKAVIALDARDPLSWRIPQLEKSLQAKKVDIFYALTKADLVPLEHVASWSAYLSSTFFPTFVTSARSNGAGVEALSTVLSKTKKLQSVAVFGLENSGRTLLANSLAAQLPEQAVLDTPALILSTSKHAHPDDVDDEEEDEEEESDDALEKRDRQAAHRVLIRNAGGIFKVHEPLPLIDALMRRTANQSDLMMAYTTPAFVDTNDFLVGVARASGRLRNGHEPDTVAAARTVLHQWSSGAMGYYAKLPSTTAAQTEQDKKRAADARQTIEDDTGLARVVLPRKAWRQQWQSKEVRLTSFSSEPSSDVDETQGMLGQGAIAFTQPQGMDEDEDDEELDEDEDDEDVEFDEEDDDEEEDDEDED